MREGFIRYKSLNWTDHLQDYIANRNNSKHSVTKQTPKTLWEPGQQKLKELDKHQMKNIDDKLIYSDIDQLRMQAKRKLEAKAARDVARFQVEEYKKGDSVRVLNSSLYSKVRKHIKAGNEKLVPVKYSPTIYEIDKIIIPIPGKEEFMNDRYTLIDPDTGEPVLQELKKNNPNAERVPKLFFASELQRVDKNTEQVLTRAQANKLNKVVDQLDIDDAKAKAKEKRKTRKEQGPTEQQIANQLFNDEPTRRFINNSMGAYDSVTQRYYLSSRYSNYNVELVDLFKHAHLPLLHPKDDIQLRVYMDSLQNCALIAPAGSSGVSGILNCGAIKANLLAKVSRLQHQHVQLLNKHHLRPNHYKFLETRFGTFNINAGTGSTTIVLTPIVGLVSYLFFTVRNATAAGVEDDNQYTYLPITQFAILDNTSTNIVGGQAISGDYALSFLNKSWCKSSYTAETAYGVVNNNAYVYMYSFSADPVESALTGVGYNAHRFLGNEQLQLTFPVSANNLQVDLYAMAEAVLESTQTYVKKISL